MRLLTIGTSTMFGNYWTNYNRTASDSWSSHLYTNKEYITTKNHFIQNFTVLNRSFTHDEIQQFLHNKDLHTKGKKKYVYNPALHNSVAEYNEEYERVNNGKYDLSRRSRDEIRQRNQAKIDNGETIVEFPNDKHLADHDHVTLRSNKSQAFTGEHILQ